MSTALLTAEPALAPADIKTLIDATLDNAGQIATLPIITLKVIELVDSPRSTAQDLHKLISNDPVLVTRILKVVNSAFYGLPGQIGSINRAIVLLGLNAVKNIVISASLAKMFRGGVISPQFAAKDLWSHSAAVATMSRMLAVKINNTLPDEAFLAGLIHDIGILVELQSLRPGLAEVARRAAAEETGYLTIEAAVLGVDHQQLGRGLCARWKFPRSFQYVTGHHHDPFGLAAELRFLTAVVYLADHVCCRMRFGYALTCKGEMLDPRIFEELGISEEDVDRLAKDLPEAIRETRSLLE